MKAIRQTAALTNLTTAHIDVAHSPRPCTARISIIYEASDEQSFDFMSPYETRSDNSENVVCHAMLRGQTKWFSQTAPPQVLKRPRPICQDHIIITSEMGNRLATIHQRYGEHGQTDNGTIAQAKAFYKRSPNNSKVSVCSACNSTDPRHMYRLQTESLWSPYVIGQTIIFSCCGLFFFFFFFLSSFFSSPNLIGRRLDVYHTLAHGVALVRI